MDKAAKRQKLNHMEIAILLNGYDALEKVINKIK